jgi:hypothetical protein
VNVYSYITKLCIGQASIIIVMKIKMYAILDKAKVHIENLRGLNLAAVTCTTVKVS